MSYHLHFKGGEVRLQQSVDGLISNLSGWNPVTNRDWLEKVVRGANASDKAALGKVKSLFTSPAPVHKAHVLTATPSKVDFFTCLQQVLAHYNEVLAKLGPDPRRHPFYGRGRKWVDDVLNREAERRFVEWQKACRKLRPWYEIIKTPHVGTDHRVRVIRKFRDQEKALNYAIKRQEKEDKEHGKRVSSYDVQTRQSVVPVERPKALLGFDPNQAKESIMAKAKGKKAAKKGNGAAKPGVKKDKAYYLRCAAGKEDCGSGDYIRGLVLKGELSAESIAGLAKKKFKGTTKPSDVYWNRGQLKAQGITPPEMGDK